MAKFYSLLVLVLLFGGQAYAQNVGIGTNTPTSKLDINGALSLREGPVLTLQNGGASGGTNDNIALPDMPTGGKAGFYRITGPTAAFSVFGIVPNTNADGQVLTLVNTTSQVMTIKNNASSTAANGFKTLTNSDMVSVAGNSSVTLQYNKTDSRWYVTGSQNYVITTGSVATGDITTSNSAISMTNNTGRLVGTSTMTINVADNGLNQKGLVPGPTGSNGNQVWGTDNTGAPAWQKVNNNQLINNSVTVSPGTGMSGGGTVALGGTITLTNNGDTDPSNDITNTTSAGGDLTGTYPNPTVAKIRNTTVSTTAPTNGQVLKYNSANTQWEPGVDNNGGGTVTGVTASNGLNSTGGTTPDIKLGGTLATNTDVALNSKNLSFSGAGNVSIGTTSTPGTLSVNGTEVLGAGLTSRAALGLTVSTSSATTYAANTDLGDGSRQLSIVNENGTAGNMAVLSMRANANGGANNQMVDMKMVSGATGKLIYSFGPAAVFTDRFTMTSDGNFGVGSTSPIAKTHVVTTTSDGNVASWGTGQLVVGQDANAGGLGLSYSTGNNAAYLSALAPNVAWKDLGFRALNTIFYYNGATEGMRLNSSGNVGIGTAPGVKLDVAGTTAVDYLRIDPQDNVNEGGEMQLVGAGSNPTIQIDNYVGNIRIHTLGTGGIFQVIGGSGLSATALSGGGTRPLYTDNSGTITTGAPTSGAIGYWTRTGTNLYNTNTGDNVGVGMSGPQHQLTVGTTVNDNQLVTIRGYSNTPASWKGGAAFGYTGASVIMGELSGAAQIGGHNANLSAWAPLAINAGGTNIGLGTSTINNRVQLQSDNSSQALQFNTSGYIAANQWGTRMYKSDIGGGIPLKVESQYGSTPWYASADFDHGQDNGHPSLKTYYNTQLAVTSGNVGVGQTAPNAKLDISSNGGSDGIAISQANGDNTETIQTYIDGQYANRVSYAGGCCNALLLQPDVGVVGIGTTGPASKLHVMGKINLHQSGAGGGQNRFEGLEGPTSANGRAQLVLSSAYSDLVVASSQNNDNHGSTISMVTYNPSNAGDYRKWVLNQGNWGARSQFLDFGYASTITNPHSAINSGAVTLTMDGSNRYVGLNAMNPNTRLTVDGTGMGNTAAAEIRGAGTHSWGVGLVMRTTGGTDGAAILFRSRDAKNWQVRGETSGTGFQITEDGGDAQYGSGFGTPRMHFSAGGNVGIGTTTPGERLSVVGKTTLSRDAAPECCSGGNYTLAISESTSSTGNQPTIQFHAGGYHEGYIRLLGSQGGFRRMQFGDYQGQNMGIETSGQIMAGSSTASIGTHPTYGSNFAALWKNGSDYGIMTDATNTLINSPSINGNLYFRSANSEIGHMHRDALNTSPGSMSGDLWIWAVYSWWHGYWLDVANDLDMIDNIRPKSVYNEALKRNVMEIDPASLPEVITERGHGVKTDDPNGGAINLTSAITLAYGGIRELRAETKSDKEAINARIDRLEKLVSELSGKALGEIEFTAKSTAYKGLEKLVIMDSRISPQSKIAVDGLSGFEIIEQKEGSFTLQFNSVPSQDVKFTYSSKF
jgi:hypothetical protein